MTLFIGSKRVLLTGSRLRRYMQMVAADRPLIYLPLNDNGSEFISFVSPVQGTAEGGLIGGAGRHPLSPCPDFDGSDDDISLGALGTLDAAVAGFSFEGWVNLDSVLVARSGIIGDLDLATGASTYLAIGFDTPTVYVKDGAGIDTYSATDVIGTGSWKHIAGVVNLADAKVYLYINGVLSGSPALSILTGGASPNTWYVGRGFTAGTSRFADGRIAHVAAYNYALSSSQVVAHYKAGS